MAVGNLDQSFGTLSSKDSDRDGSRGNDVYNDGNNVIATMDNPRKVNGCYHDRDAADGPPDGIVDFVTLGMLVIDEIEYLPPRSPVRDVIGGAGSYATLGARLFSPPPQLSRAVGWVVDQGSDFPPAMADLIASWQTAVVMRHDPDRLTTRGWNGYGAAEQRAFRYTTPKKRLTAEDLPPSLLTARAFHIISSAARCRELVADIQARRREAIEALGDSAAAAAILTRPYIIWEPIPDRCTPDELLDCTNTLPVVDVCSPNHAELAGYMGDPDAGLDPQTGQLSRTAVERACEQLLSAMPLQSYTLVVRAAEHGCYIAKNGGRRRLRAGPSSSGGGGTQKQKQKPKKPAPKQNLHGGLRPDTDMEALFAGLLQDAEGSIAREEIEVDPGLEVWIPALSGEIADGDGDAGVGAAKSDRPRVVDPTGGGNAFLGGFTVAVARGKSLDEAAAWGNVAASFVIEQIGMPVLGRDAAGRETWNGVRVEDRLASYEARLREKGLLQDTQ